MEQGSSYIAQIGLVISTVLSEEFHLVENHCTLNKYLSLTDDAKLVFIRLFNRKAGCWIKIDSLNLELYPREGVKELLKTKLVLKRGPNNMLEKLQLLLKPDLVALASGLIRKAALKTKQDLISCLLSAVPSTDLDLKVQKILGPLIRLQDHVRCQFQYLFIIFQRMQRWPENDNFMLDSILSNLDDSEKRRNWAVTEYSRTGLVWPTLEEFKAYCDALKLEKTVAEYSLVNDNNGWERVIDICDSLLPKWIQCLKSVPESGHVTGISWFSIFTSNSVHTRILSSCYNSYFRLKEYQKGSELLRLLLSQRIFQTTKRGFWYDERAKLLERYLLDPVGARRCCMEGLSDTMVSQHRRLGLKKRLERLWKNKPGVPTVLRHQEATCAIKNSYLKGVRVYDTDHTRVVMLSNDGSTKLNVEQFALEHYALEGWKGSHSENSIVTTLFGLLFWDIIFDSNIPGVFASPYQSGPLDLKTEFFYESRRTIMKKRMEEIENGYGVNIVEKVCNTHRPLKTICVGVNWNLFTTDQIIEIVECINPSVLAQMMNLFAKSYWSHLGGVPDLCLWNWTEKLFKLVEVKSENDKLSDKQVIWLEHLKLFGIEVEVLHIFHQKDPLLKVEKKITLG
jgi:fanconi-associated nuclease 1